MRKTKPTGTKARAMTISALKAELERLSERFEIEKICSLIEGNETGIVKAGSKPLRHADGARGFLECLLDNERILEHSPDIENLCTLVRRVVEIGLNPNYSPAGRRRPLAALVRNKVLSDEQRYTLTALFLSAGADPFMRSPNSERPVDAAVRAGDAKSVRLFFKNDTTEKLTPLVFDWISDIVAGREATDAEQRESSLQSIGRILALRQDGARCLDDLEQSIASYEGWLPLLHRVALTGQIDILSVAVEHCEDINFTSAQDGCFRLGDVLSVPPGNGFYLRCPAGATVLDMVQAYRSVVKECCSENPLDQKLSDVERLLVDRGARPGSFDFEPPHTLEWCPPPYKRQIDGLLEYLLRETGGDTAQLKRLGSFYFPADIGPKTYWWRQTAVCGLLFRHESVRRLLQDTWFGHVLWREGDAFILSRGKNPFEYPMEEIDLVSPDAYPVDTHAALRFPIGGKGDVILCLEEDDRGFKVCEVSPKGRRVLGDDFCDFLYRELKRVLPKLDINPADFVPQVTDFAVTGIETCVRHFQNGRRRKLACGNARSFGYSYWSNKEIDDVPEWGIHNKTLFLDEDATALHETWDFLTELPTFGCSALYGTGIELVHRDFKILRAYDLLPPEDIGCYGGRIVREFLAAQWRVAEGIAYALWNRDHLSEVAEIMGLPFSATVDRQAVTVRINDGW